MLTSNRTDSAAQIASIYTRLAPVYGAWTWMLERRSLQRAVALAGITDGESVLEVAVGSGYVFREILRRNRSGRNVGVDLTDAMLRTTRCKAERTGVPFTLQRADARTLPFEDASFDLVLNNNMLGLLPSSDAERVVREMLRVLRPGGRMVIVTMARPHTRIPRCLYRLGAVRLGGWADVEPASIVRGCGIADVEREVVTQLGFPSEVIRLRKP